MHDRATGSSRQSLVSRAYFNGAPAIESGAPVPGSDGSVQSRDLRKGQGPRTFRQAQRERNKKMEVSRKMRGGAHLLFLFRSP
jgi:hypothetical protein